MAANAANLTVGSTPALSATTQFLLRIWLFESTAKTTSSAVKAVAADAAMLRLVTLRTVGFDRGFGGRISRATRCGSVGDAAVVCATVCWRVSYFAETRGVSSPQGPEPECSGREVRVAPHYAFPPLMGQPDLPLFSMLASAVGRHRSGPTMRRQPDLHQCPDRVGWPD
jgi:hypothetical protein